MSLTLVCACQRSAKVEVVQDSASAVGRDTLGQANVPRDSMRDAASRTAEDLTGWKTYRNERYRFEFKYPPELAVSPKFSRYDILPQTWRAMASPEDGGQAVVAVPIIHLTGRTAYPRFYDVEFRVGVSDSLGNCDATNGERAIGSIVINGATFKQFEFSDAAMMKYISGISYRMEHQGRCVAVEQIRSGSNYRDTTTPRDLSQKHLDDYYYLAGKIVRTFRFLDAK